MVIRLWSFCLERSLNWLTHPKSAWLFLCLITGTEGNLWSLHVHWLSLLGTKELSLRNRMPSPAVVLQISDLSWLASSEGQEVQGQVLNQDHGPHPLVRQVLLQDYLFCSARMESRLEEFKLNSSMCTDIVIIFFFLQRTHHLVSKYLCLHSKSRTHSYVTLGSQWKVPP